MQSLENQHNANLSTTISNTLTTVNGLGCVSTYCAPERVASPLYVKIDDKIFTLQLNIKVIEYYCLLSYIVQSKPKLAMTAETIRYQLQTLLGYSLSVNTIRKYNRILIQANTMSIQAKNRLIVLGIDHSELNCINNLRSSIHVTNTYISPKVRYTKFYPLILDGLNTTSQTTKKGDYILERYMASHNYTNTNNQYQTYTYKFHKSKVTNDLGISIKTYYNKLKSLVTKQIISKTKLVKKSLSKITDFKYTNILRVKVMDVLQPILTDLRIQIYSH
jgi:hypothetical protein